jgi:hydrogenase maturation factor HypF (carbamoyltransferase family)
LYAGSCSKYCFDRRAKEDKTNIAYWEHRAKHNDYILVECSNCGFRIENYKAVVLDRCDTKFSDVKYKFCKICGKEMRVH